MTVHPDRRDLDDEEQAADGLRVLLVGRANLGTQVAAMRTRASELGRTDIIIEPHPSVPSDAEVTAIVVLPMVKLGAAEFDGLPRLRIVCTPSVGTDHIDRAEADRRGIVVSNAPGFNTDEVAEHTITLAAMLLRNVPISANAARAGTWSAGLALPRRLSGSSLGLVGNGSIARRTAGIARALRMDVAVWSPRTVPGWLAPGIRAVETLGELYSDRDIVSLHLPLLPETHHLLGEAAFAAMRRGTMVINTARGGLVDSRALIAALDSGHVAAAALDVLEHEPPDRHDPLLSHPRVVVTPHMAWLSPNSAVAAYRTAVDAVASLLPGVHNAGSSVQPCSPALDSPPASAADR